MEYCNCKCGCKNKLLTASSRRLMKCSDCRIGNCKGNRIIEMVNFLTPNRIDKEDKNV